MDMKLMDVLCESTRRSQEEAAAEVVEAAVETEVATPAAAGMFKLCVVVYD